MLGVIQLNTYYISIVKCGQTTADSNLVGYYRQPIRSCHCLIQLYHHQRPMTYHLAMIIYKHYTHRNDKQISDKSCHKHHCGGASWSTGDPWSYGRGHQSVVGIAAEVIAAFTHIVKSYLPNNLIFNLRGSSLTKLNSCCQIYKMTLVKKQPVAFFNRYLSRLHASTWPNQRLICRNPVIRSLKVLIWLQR